MRPLADRSRALYARMIERAYGSGFPVLIADLGTWTPGCLALLRAAVRREALDRGLDPEILLKAIPGARPKAKIPRVPGEQETQAYEIQASILPTGKRALALLPLLSGLRAEELLALDRAQIEYAIRTGELILIRKGGEEHILPAAHVRPLLEELLNTPPARPRGLNGKAKKRWSRVGEILSAGKPITQYHHLRELVRATALEARVPGGRPHILRHAFASRMDRDGASMFTIQTALGHADIKTTQRYVHKTARDVAVFMRPVPS